MNPGLDNAYRALQRDLAAALCPVEGAPPCADCEKAAYRVMAHRRAVRTLLVDFARLEADLVADDGPRHPGDEFDPMERVGWPRPPAIPKCPDCGGRPEKGGYVVHAESCPRIKPRKPWEFFDGD